MRSRRTAATIAAIAAATLLLGGCGSSVSGEAAPSRSVTEKAATVTGVAPLVTGPGPVGQLQDVTGQGVIRRSPRDSARWAPEPEPGGLVSTANDGCTLGPAVTRAGKAGFLIAGHCVKDGGTQWARVNAAADSPLPLGPAVEGDTVTDSAVIWTDTAADDTRIAGKWPVRGVLSVEQLSAVPAGAPICVNAAISGVHCGGMIAVDAAGLAMLAPAKQGDSGSAVFVVDSRGDAWIAGVLKDGEGSSLATPIATILGQLRASVITS